jgi:hypothetical protein
MNKVSWVYHRLVVRQSVTLDSSLIVWVIGLGLAVNVKGAGGNPAGLMKLAYDTFKLANRKT